PGPGVTSARTAPSPAMRTTSTYSANVAVTDRSPSSGKSHDATPSQSPVQPTNGATSAGAGSSETLVPLGNATTHDSLHSVVPSSDVIMTVPVPSGFTVRWRRASASAVSAGPQPAST